LFRLRAPQSPNSRRCITGSRRRPSLPGPNSPINFLKTGQTLTTQG